MRKMTTQLITASLIYEEIILSVEETTSGSNRWRDKEHIRLCERVLPEKAVSICGRLFGRAGNCREADCHGSRQSGRQGNHHCGIGENE